MEILLIAIALGLPGIPFFIRNRKARRRLEMLKIPGIPDPEQSLFQTWKVRKRKALFLTAWGWIGLMTWAVFPPSIIVLALAFSYAMPARKRAEGAWEKLPDGMRQALHEYQ